MTVAPISLLPPDRVIAIWNRVAEDTGSLEQTLLRFAAELLAAAEAARAGGTGTANRLGCGGAA